MNLSKISFLKSKRFIITAIIVLIIAVIAILQANAAAKKKIKNVTLSELKSKNITQSIIVTGNLEANDKDEIKLDGTQKVKEIFVEEGQQVKSGDELITLDTTDLEYQLRKNQINLDINRLDLIKLQKSPYRNDKKSLENAVAQAELSLENANNAYQDIRRKHDQNKALYQAGNISKDEYDSSEKAMKDSDNALKTAQLALTNSENALAEFNISNKEKIQEQSKQIDLSQADIDNLNKKIADSTIKAAIDGTVVKLDVTKDKYPTTGNYNIIIHDKSAFKIKFNVSQYDAVSMKLGQKAQIKVKGLSKKYSASITFIGEAAEKVAEKNNPDEMKVKVEATLDSPDEMIKAGYEADAEIVLSEKSNILAVNFEAVRQEPDGRKYIFIAQDGKSVKKYVTTGLETDFDIEILDGLKANDKYILNPPQDLKDGDKIKTDGGK